MFAPKTRKCGGRERERERERECVCVCVCERERECVCVCVCVLERERERERALYYITDASAKQERPISNSLPCDIQPGTGGGLG